MSFMSRAIRFAALLTFVLSIAFPSTAGAVGQFDETTNVTQSHPVEPSLADLVDRFIQCNAIDEEIYCTSLGFVEIVPGTREWDRQVGRLLRARPSGGDGNLATYLQWLNSLEPAESKALLDNELQSARSAVAQLKLVDLVASGSAIPEGFFSAYPQLGIVEGSELANALRVASLTGPETPVLATLAELKVVTKEEGLDESLFALQPRTSSSGQPDASTQGYPAVGGPTSRYIIYSYYTRQDNRYYCGPATMQAIDWANDGSKETQYAWATVMGTTSQGTWINSLVNAVKSYTSWDSSTYGGAYSVISLSGKSSTWFMIKHEIRIGLYGAPIVEHPVLKKAYFPYLAKDHGGHYQTGRGYSYNSDTIAIFEPLDECDLDYSPCNNTGTRQYVSYVNLFNATVANQNTLGG